MSEADDNALFQATNDFAPYKPAYKKPDEEPKPKRGNNRDDKDTVIKEILDRKAIVDDRRR